MRHRGSRQRKKGWCSPDLRPGLGPGFPRCSRQLRSPRPITHFRAFSGRSSQVRTLEMSCFQPGSVSYTTCSGGVWVQAWVWKFEAG